MNVNEEEFEKKKSKLSISFFLTLFEKMP